MKIILCFTLAAPLFAADLDRFLDIKATYVQRDNACIALAGNKSPEVIKAMRDMLPNLDLQSCAGSNLRLAGAVDELISALNDPEPTVRAIAARELGTMQKPEFLPLLRHAADDADILAASNAIEGLARYQDHSSAPQLREIASKSGVLATLALNNLIDWKDPQVLAIGRKLVMSPQPDEQLIGIRAIGLTGNASDLPKLQELAKDDVNLGSGGRGFGFMPAVSISRAAKVAILNIRNNM